MARTILLADDSMTIQKVVELTFMDEDYQVVTVSDGNAAIQKLSEMQPNLLITDVHMPGANGYDVCRHAKSTHPGLPVLLLVGTFEQFDEGEAQACGSDGFLKKPFDSQELLTRVEKMVVDTAPASVAAPAAAPMVVPSAAPQPERAPIMPPSAPVAPQAPVVEPPPSLITAPPAAEAPPPVISQPVSAPVAPEPPAPEPAAPQPAAPEPMETAQTRPMPKPPTAANGSLSDEDVDRIARRVAELIGEKALKEIAWEVLPDLAEVVVRERIHELERQVEST